ncbi:formimidoylglutamate deiminase [Novosphingobium terrae]|uniref:formimidoylglutamate deiminase n=1 Tax=Novosphingobium terrae TaxID=2726189 RepID=UPI0019817B93|nr:formimidoylglutamate deiminase [Novosphingobium terrae]
MPHSASLHFDLALLPDGWASDVRIDIADGLIARLERGASPTAAAQRHSIALPGLPNLHSHAFQRGMAGLAETRGPSGDSFWTWREVMYRFLARMGPDEMQAIAALAYMEMLEAGFTRVGEFHYLHHAPDGRAYADPAEMSARLAAAAQDTGLGLTLLPVFYAHAGFGGQAPGEGQRRFLCSPDQYAVLHEAARGAVAPLGDAVVGIAPHSLRAVTPKELGHLLPLAGEAPIHIHIAEQQREVEDCLSWSGQRPVAWLLDHMPVDRRWCLVHATHMTLNETHHMAQTGAIAGLCPITEANLGDGLFPMEDYLAAGGHYGIGSDSNVRIDATEELRLLEYGQRLSRQGRNLLAREAGASTGAALYNASLRGGGQALGVEAGLAVGLSADIVSLKGDHPSLTARSGDALLDGLIFSAGREAVDCVWRRGRMVVADGRHVQRDTITASYRSTLAKLLA